MSIEPMELFTKAGYDLEAGSDEDHGPPNELVKTSCDNSDEVIVCSVDEIEDYGRDHHPVLNDILSPEDFTGLKQWLNENVEGGLRPFDEWQKEADKELMAHVLGDLYYEECVVIRTQPPNPPHLLAQALRRKKAILALAAEYEIEIREEEA